MTDPGYTVDVVAYEDKYAKYDGVYLNYDAYLEHTGSRDGSRSWVYYVTLRRRYVLLNPDQEYATTFELWPGRFTDIEELYLRVVSPDGTERRFSREDLIEETDEDGFTKIKFVYPDVRKGSIIEEGYSIAQNSAKDRPPFWHFVKLQRGWPVERFRFIYSCPEWWKLKIKNTAERTAPVCSVTIDSTTGMKRIEYTGSFVPAYEDEPYSPYYKESTPYLQFAVSYMLMSNRYFKAAKDWKEFGRYYRVYTTGNFGAVPASVERAARAAAKNARLKEEIIDTIVTFVQHEMELVEGHLGERTFGQIFRSREGNAFEICGLTRAMLDKVGVRADFFLVHSASDGYFDSLLISSSQLYTPVLRVEYQGQPRLVIPYWRSLPVGLVPHELQGQIALYISHDADEDSYFWTTPVEHVKNSTIEEEYTLDIDEDGAIQTLERKTFRGHMAYWIRRILKEFDDDEFDKEVKEMLTYTDGDVKVDSHEVVNLDNYNEPLVIKLTYRIDNLVTVTPEEVVFQTGGLFSPVSLSKLKIDTEERTNPIAIYYDQSYVKAITINHPPNWKLRTKLEEIDYSNTFGNVTRTCVRAKGRLTVKQKRLLKESRAPKEDISDLLKITGGKGALSLPSIVFGVGRK